MSVIDAIIAAGVWMWANKDELGLRGAELWHGVTNVKTWRNDTDDELEVWKLDGSSQRQDHYRIPPRGSGGGDMWIPWADNPAQYATKQAVIQVGGIPLAYVWQSGSRVRFNSVDAFVSGGQAVPGEARAGGNRTVLVSRDPQGRLGFVFSG